MNADRAIPGSARGSRAGFGDSPKRNSGRIDPERSTLTNESSRERAALASTRAACAPQIPAEPPVQK